MKWLRPSIHLLLCCVMSCGRVQGRGQLATSSSSPFSSTNVRGSEGMRVLWENIGMPPFPSDEVAQYVSVPSP